MARLDTWSDAEVLAAVTALASLSDWGQGAVGGNRAAQQAQLDAFLQVKKGLIATQGTAIIGELPYTISGLPAGKLQLELQHRFDWKDNG
jgi:hypothetical protein